MLKNPKGRVGRKTGFKMLAQEDSELSPTDKTNMQLYMKSFLLKKTRKQMSRAYTIKDKKDSTEMGKRGRDTTLQKKKKKKYHPGTAIHYWEKSQKYETFP